MKQKFFIMIILFCALVALLTGALFYAENLSRGDSVNADRVLAVNEIEQLAKIGDLDAVREKAALLSENMRIGGERDGSRLLILGGGCILMIVLAFLYLFVTVLKPFDELKAFAAEIAKGNLEIPLSFRRTNFFGAFTWAFDSMRMEISKARSGEKEAVENNKTVIAALSHDIKTPIASIKAYAEGLEANMDNTFEKREKYLSVIMKKCDEVSKLTDDLFTHSLSDLDKLKIIPEKTEIGEFIEAALKDIGAERGDIHFEKPGFTAYVNIDRKRFVQVVENIVNNARKYAKSDINVFITKENANIELFFKDNGEGIPDEDMPFVFGKFYRGRNCGDEQGSGLGLYIVKYIVEKSGGKVRLCNREGGLEAVISLPLVHEEEK